MQYVNMKERSLAPERVATFKKYPAHGILIFLIFPIFNLTMKRIYTLLVAGIFIANSSFAQKTPAKPAKQTVKDTFAINLLNSIDKLLGMATKKK